MKAGTKSLLFIRDHQQAASIHVTGLYFEPHTCPEIQTSTLRRLIIEDVSELEKEREESWHCHAYAG